ncbi:SRPBCC family protein [Cochlodiniinecator piscidefendens]|uniref:SRPBCC family protein n=1 Tax=Cochlodiniinecator piscidefendens TaxID=2715756 RepID=UPI0014087D1C|nr:SRPBCC family protein [Cochlodiniinecator piscidefendens]
MKFSTREDIQAPIHEVFAAVSDFQAFERLALRRGATVHPRTSLVQANALKGWDLGFKFRSKDRQVAAELVRNEAPNGLDIITISTGLRGEVNVELLALAANRTRLSVTTELKPTSIGGRLTVQSLKLVKSNLTRRYKKRIAEFADEIEKRR